MSHRYSSSTNASRVAEGLSRGGLYTKPPVAEKTFPASDEQSHRTLFGAFSVASGKTGRIAKRLSSRISEPSTFYREATPPGSSQGDEPQEPEHAYDGRYDHVAPPAPLPVATICGIRRRKFLILLWSIIAAIVIIIAVALGVVFGLRSRHHSSTSSNPLETSRYATPSHSITTANKPYSTPTSTTIPPTSTSPTPTSTNAASTSIIPCPAANNTRYLVPDTDKVFQRLCGVDFSGVDQARDLGSVWTTTMQECIFQCADFPGCSACGWGIIQDDPGSEHRCWLKTDLKTAHSTRAGWDFAILEQ